MTTRDQMHNRVFRARAGVIMPGCGVGTNQRGVGGAGQTDYVTVVHTDTPGCNAP